MGYYTSYELEIYEGGERADPKAAAAAKDFRDLMEFEKIEQLPYSKVRQQLGKQAETHFAKMLELKERLAKLMAKAGLCKATDLLGTNKMSSEDLLELIRGAWEKQAHEMKWYEHVEHVALISKLFPELVLVLRGEGEEAGDLWVKYFHAGKVQVEKATITYGPFDPKKLK